MISSSNVFCRQIVEIAVAHGVGTVYCSPGSRNAPLLLALEEYPQIKKHVVVDERSSAFQALGCSLVERRPVMLVCTSGTAVLNYAPAVAEAYYSGIPLIVVSADRPSEWVDQDDSQTIRQYKILDSIVKGSYDLRAIAECGLYTDNMRWMVNRTVNEAMLTALCGKPGPVHINVQLSDPLGEICEPDRLSERIVSMVKTSDAVEASSLRLLASEFASSKVMLVAGFMPPDHKLNRAVRALASLPNVVVMAETLANLHEPQPLSSMIDSVLCRMGEKEKERLRPDIVISVGGALVSRMLKQYLRDFPPERHWGVGHSNYFCDCFKSLTERIDVQPALFLRQLAGASRKTGIPHPVAGYSGDWLRLREEAAVSADNYIFESPWSDLKAFAALMKKMRFDNLFVSNGTPVRYSQILPHTSHAEYCNRGVSGIDGVTSTAVGAAKAYKGQTTLITGDMSWTYDSGVSALNDLPHDMRIVVIDNSGGGIFRFVKSTSMIPADVLDRYFCVGNLPDIALLASAHGLDIMEADDEASLDEGMMWLSEKSETARLLVVKTPPLQSAETLKGYFCPHHDS